MYLYCSCDMLVAYGHLSQINWLIDWYSKTRNTTVCDAWPVRRQTYGYLPGRRALPLGRYSFPVTLRVGVWVDLSGWLHTKMAYPQTVPHVCNNRIEYLSNVMITRSTGTVHTSAKERLTSVAIRIRIRDPNRHHNLIFCSSAHGQPSLKISCRSIRNLFAQSC